MTISQRGGSWVVTVGSKDDRFRRSFKSHDEALKVEAREIAIRGGVIDRPQSTAKAHSGSQVGVTKGHTLAEAYKLALKDTWAGSKTNAQAKNARQVMNNLGETTPVSKITPALIREMVEEFEDMGNTGSTVNKKLSALSVMLKCAADEEWIDALPRIKRRKGGTNRLRWLDAEEELKILAVCDQHGLSSLKDFIIVGIDTGFRKGELLNFKVKQYHHEMLHLHPDETKTSKPRSIPATDRVKDIIKRRSNQENLFADLSPHILWDMWDFMRQTVGMADDPHFVVHMLRHTCASRFAMADKSTQFIQEWMGHSTPLTTAKYMHLAPGKLAEGTEALDEYRRAYTPKLKIVG